MNKLKFNLNEVGEILTREQLKQVFGGSSGGSGKYKCCVGEMCSACVACTITPCRCMQPEAILSECS